MTLVEFLAEQLAVDEEWGQAVLSVVHTGGGEWWADHLRSAASRAIAEVEMRRELIAEYQEAIQWYNEHRSAPAGEVHGIERALKHLAAIYASRPGYNQAWRP